MMHLQQLQQQRQAVVGSQQRRLQQQQQCARPRLRCCSSSVACQQRPTAAASAATVPCQPQQPQQWHQQRHPSSATAAATAAATAGAATAAVCADLQQLSGAEARAVGSLVGAMCGNALGAQVEPEKHYRVSRMFPSGCSDMSWSFDISASPLPPGHVTGDFVTMAAVGQSLVQAGAADALGMCDAMAASYDAAAPEHWYSPYSRLSLEGLAAGSNPFLLARHADAYLGSTASRASNTASHRPGRQMHGKTDFTALPRVIPVALAYRDAPLEVLRQAAEAAVLLTHPTDTAADAAVVLAAAVAWCVRSDPDSSSPGQLLQHLAADVATTADMRDKLALLQERLPALADLGSIDSWPVFWRSKAWSDVTAVANLLTKQNLAVEATQAAALALWVLAVSWQQPKQAVMLAASLGGYAATTGTLVGGLAGALHGSQWVPAPWWEQLQDGKLAQQQQQHDAAEAAVATGDTAHEQPQEADTEEEGGVEGGVEEGVGFGKHDVVLLGQQLAQLDCRPPSLL